jgi:hypothetical protein
MCEPELVVVVFDAVDLWLWDARRTDSWTFVSMPVETWRRSVTWLLDRVEALVAARAGHGQRQHVGDFDLPG